MFTDSFVSVDCDILTNTEMTLRNFFVCAQNECHERSMNVCHVTGPGTSRSA